jgi:DNA-binding NtrC family response regulator
MHRASFFGESSSLIELRKLALRVADAPFSVLIQAESGCGKFELATLIHERSWRASEPFIEVHCANLTEALFESTLFGHERGAFTDARERREGRVTVAKSGTILLDDVDCLSPMQQAKLLRLIDRQTYEPVGATETLTTPARFLFASNRDLWQLCVTGAFREDLYARMSWCVLRIPPLRERPEDIILLATLMLEEARTRYNLPVLRWSDGALKRLRRHTWPGNVRELKALADVAAYLHGESGAISAEAVDSLLASRYGGESADSIAMQMDLPTGRTEAEKRIIEEALRQTDGNRVEAAKLLRIGRRTLHTKITKYRL